MTYTTADARKQLLDSLAEAAEALGMALASLSEAYEQLDEQTAERMERELFRPVQLAYGRARSTQTGFATRHGLPVRELAQASHGAPSHGVKGFLESASEDVRRAESGLATLQDTLLPVEVGDADLRAGLEQVRELLSGFDAHTRELVRTFGR